MTTVQAEKIARRKLSLLRTGPGTEPLPIPWTIGRLNHAAFRVSSTRTWTRVRYPWRSRSHSRL